MGFSTHLGISGTPEFEVNIKAAPLAFQIGGEASLAVSAGPFSGHVGQIPLQVRVPFLKSNHGYVMAAALGPFDVHLREVNATLRAFGVEFGGVLGREGIDCDLAGVVRCRMDVDVNGKLPGKIVEAAVKAVFEE